MVKGIKNIISVLVIMVFTVTNIVPAYGHNNPTLFKQKSQAQRYLKEQEQEKEAIDIKNTPTLLSITQNLGKVLESYKGKGDALVIHIQDRHADTVAQLNISAIIGELTTKYNTSLICLEGASKELNTSFYDKFPDGPIKTKISKLFLQKALFTGAEFYKITHKDQYLRAEGVENKDAYLRHLASYQNNQAGKDAVLSLLGALKADLSALKEKAYPKNLLELNKVSASYAAKELKLPEYLNKLTKYSEKAKINISKHKELNKFIELTKKEERIDFKKAEAEREALINKLSEVLGQEDLTGFVTKSLQYRVNKISSDEFYTYLCLLIGKQKLDIRQYKNLTAYIDYLKFSKEIDHLKVFDETEDLEEETEIALCQNQIQQRLVACTKAVRLLDGLYSLKLTHRNLDYMQKDQQSFDIAQIQNFLKDISARYGLNLSTAVTSTRLPPRAVENSREFYQIALKRDIALIDNTLKNMKRYRKDKAILITGGFHTPGITNILKDKNISYVVICPNIGSDDCDKVYADRMAGKLPDIAELAESLRNMLVTPLVTGDAAKQTSDVQRIFGELVEKGANVAIPKVVSPAKSAKRFNIAVSIGGHKIAVNLVDEDAGLLLAKSVEVKWREKLGISEDSPGFWDKVNSDRFMDLITSLIKDALTNAHIDITAIGRIGIAFAGPVDSKTGVAGTPLAAPHTPFKNYPICQELRDGITRNFSSDSMPSGFLADMPFELLNDCRAALKGERSAKGALYDTKTNTPIPGCVMIVGSGINIDADDPSVKETADQLIRTAHLPRGYSPSKGTYTYTGLETLGDHPKTESGELFKGGIGDECSGPNIARRFAEAIISDKRKEAHDVKEVIEGILIEEEGLLTEFKGVTVGHILNILVKKGALNKEEERLRSRAMDIVLISITQAALKGNVIAKEWIKKIGTEIGQALAAFIAAKRDAKYIYHIVLVSGVNENFGKGVIDEQGRDLYLSAIRGAVKQELMRFYGEKSKTAKLIADGIVRSSLTYERELIAFAPEKIAKAASAGVAETPKADITPRPPTAVDYAEQLPAKASSAGTKEEGVALDAMVEKTRIYREAVLLIHLLRLKISDDQGAGVAPSEGDQRDLGYLESGLENCRKAMFLARAEAVFLIAQSWLKTEIAKGGSAADMFDRLNRRIQEIYENILRANTADEANVLLERLESRVSGFYPQAVIDVLELLEAVIRKTEVTYFVRMKPWRGGEFISLDGYSRDEFLRIAESVRENFKKKEGIDFGGMHIPKVAVMYPEGDKATKNHELGHEWFGAVLRELSKINSSKQQEFVNALIEIAEQDWRKWGMVTKAFFSNKSWMRNMVINLDLAEEGISAEDIISIGHNHFRVLIRLLKEKGCSDNSIARISKSLCDEVAARYFGGDVDQEFWRGCIDKALAEVGYDGELRKAFMDNTYEDIRNRYTEIPLARPPHLATVPPQPDETAKASSAGEVIFKFRNFEDWLADRPAWRDGHNVILNNPQDALGYFPPTGIPAESELKPSDMYMEFEISAAVKDRKEFCRQIMANFCRLGLPYEISIEFGVATNIRRVVIHVGYKEKTYVALDSGVFGRGAGHTHPVFEINPQEIIQTRAVIMQEFLNRCLGLVFSKDDVLGYIQYLLLKAGERMRIDYAEMDTAIVSKYGVTVLTADIETIKKITQQETDEAALHKIYEMVEGLSEDVVMPEHFKQWGFNVKTVAHPDAEAIVRYTRDSPALKPSRPYIYLAAEIATAETPAKASSAGEAVLEEKMALPEIVTEYLMGEPSLGWFTHSIELDDSQVDPFYRIVAELEGGVAIFGGGSDLVQLILGLTRSQAGMSSDVNVIRSRAELEEINPDGIVKVWRSYNELNEQRIIVPPFGSRKEPIVLDSIMVNPESSFNWIRYVKNAREGRYLIDGNPSLNVPLKHTAIAVIPVNGKGPVRLFFRTQEDLRNYQNKLLTLPDAERYPADWGANIDRMWVLNTIDYCIVVYARSKANGWRFEAKSLKIIKDLAGRLTVREITGLIKSIRRKIKDDFESEEELAKTLNDVLREFGIAHRIAIGAKETKASSAGEIETMAGGLSEGCRNLLSLPYDRHFGQTPYRYGLIIDDATFRGQEKGLLEFLASRPTSNGKSKFIILVKTTQGRENLIKKWGLPRENVSTLDDFLTQRGLDLSEFDSEQAKIITATRLLKNQIGINQPVGVIAGPSMDIEAMAYNMKEQNIEGVFISSQEPADVNLEIDGKTSAVKGVVLFEALLTDILTKLKSYDPKKVYSIKELIEILPAITSTDFINKIDMLKATIESLAKAA